MAIRLDSIRHLIYTQQSQTEKKNRREWFKTEYHGIRIVHVWRKVNKSVRRIGCRSIGCYHRMRHRVYWVRAQCRALLAKSALLGPIMNAFPWAAKCRACKFPCVYDFSVFASLSKSVVAIETQVSGYIVVFRIRSVRPNTEEERSPSPRPSSVSKSWECL